MDLLSDTLEKYNAVSLSEMDTVKLMNRTETKYVFAASQLPHILEGLSSDYHMLEIDGIRRSAYTTVYFDTEELKFYHEHHNGKLSRQKIRIRKYMDSDQAFIEVKTKNSKGRTIKKREKEAALSAILSENAAAFVTKHVEIDPKEISAKLLNSYRRITLVNLISKERVTLDLDLEFKHEGEKVKVHEIVIGEVKQEKYNVNSSFIQQMRSFHIRSMSMSKYCLGSVLLKKEMNSKAFKEGLKYNKFKEKVLTIDKIKNGSSQ